eukprot:5665013-Amphidinium_carterae.1
MLLTDKAGGQISLSRVPINLYHDLLSRGTSPIVRDPGRVGSEGRPNDLSLVSEVLASARVLSMSM